MCHRLQVHGGTPVRCFGVAETTQELDGLAYESCTVAEAYIQELQDLNIFREIGYLALSCLRLCVAPALSKKCSAFLNPNRTRQAHQSQLSSRTKAQICLLRPNEHHESAADLYGHACRTTHILWTIVLPSGNNTLPAISATTANAPVLNAVRSRSTSVPKLWLQSSHITTVRRTSYADEPPIAR